MQLARYHNFFDTLRYQNYVWYTILDTQLSMLDTRYLRYMSKTTDYIRKKIIKVAV